MVKKWEYKVIHEITSIYDQEVELERRGEEGWELVSVHTFRDEVLLYLKRPK